ncbi:MAG: molybdopterin molybdotransferase MoeA [Bacteroidales bacterium]
MIKFHEALSIVEQVSFRVATERVPLKKAVGRVLAEEVFSDMDMPPFNKSAVDGYACRLSDLSMELEVLEIVPAGKTPEKKVSEGTCIKIMTGAPVPEGADAVIMVEDVEETGPNKIRYLKDKVKDNICLTGEDIRKGDLMLTPGTLLKPQHIAVLASVGVTEPRVYRKVQVGIISTGDELVEPSVKPAPAQIRNSNAWQLYAQVLEMGAIPDYIGIAEDNEESTRKKIVRALEGNDVVLLTGGVSMGDYDYVPKVMKDLGLELKFDSIAVQPGRPTTFAARQRQFVFGLPGNPVSSFVQFNMLVKPFIYLLSGHKYRPVMVRTGLATDYNRKKSTRMGLVPVRLNDDYEAVPLEYHGSAHINAYVDADGFMIVPMGVQTIKKGESADIRLI